MVLYRSEISCWWRKNPRILNLSPCTQKMCSLLPWYTEFPVYWIVSCCTLDWNCGLHLKTCPFLVIMGHFDQKFCLSDSSNKKRVLSLWVKKLVWPVALTRKLNISNDALWYSIVQEVHTDDENIPRIQILKLCAAYAYEHDPTKDLRGLKTGLSSDF
jgi:hypothetical protein